MSEPTQPNASESPIGRPPVEPTVEASGAPAGGTVTPPSRPDWLRPQPVTRSSLPGSVFLMAAGVLALIALLFVVGKSGRKSQEIEKPAEAIAEKTPDPSGYAAYVARNKALIQKSFEQKTLTDEEFAGESPLRVRDAGPLVSPEVDPQLAAIAQALANRVRIFNGSRETLVNKVLTRTIKGEYRGFRVSAVEKLSAGDVSFSEIVLQTPSKGMVKSTNRVLTALDRTDLARLLGDLQAAGLEIVPLPGDEKSYRAQLRVIRPWGKPIAADKTIGQRAVGSLTLGMPIAQIRQELPNDLSILKRRIMVNDVYHDVYKVTDAKGEPLFYAYDKGGRILGISIVHPSYRTDNGVGIGSTMDQMRLHYGQVRFSHSQKRAPVVRVEGIDGVFILQSDAQPEVIAILIGESPEFE